MAKQKVEKKSVITVCGRLEKDEDGTFIVIVEDKDDVQEYVLSDLLNEMQGYLINLNAELF